MSLIEQRSLSSLPSVQITSPPPEGLSPLANTGAVLSRQWRRMAIVFLTMMAAVVAVTILAGNKYESEFKVLVNRERPGATSSDPAAASRAVANVTEEEVNTEVALLKSRDLLSKVVSINGLDGPPKNAVESWLEKWRGGAESRNARAIRKLAGTLHVEAVKKSNIIDVTYSSPEPELSAKVLRTLADLYLTKHVAVHEVPGAHDFFAQQVKMYETNLRDAENALAKFGKVNSTAAPQVERDFELQRLADLRIQKAQNAAAVQSALARKQQIQMELAKTAPRLVTQMKVADNAHLLGDLKTTLLNLQLKRTDLATKFAPDYPAVKELDTQISQTMASIQAESAKPVTDNATDQNPVYQWLSAELAKVNSELPALTVQARSADDTATRTESQVLRLNDDNIVQQALLRDVKVAEANYMLYLQKFEQAKISDELDRRQISNVVLAEEPAPSPLPVRSPLTTVAIGLLVCLMISGAVGFASDYLDPTFRNWREIESVLDSPVLAAIPIASSRSLVLGNMSVPEIAEGESAGA